MMFRILPLLLLLVPSQAPVDATTVDAAVKGIPGYDRKPEAPIRDDAAFLKRLSRDLVDVEPSDAELQAFVEDKASDKRSKAIERLLADERFGTAWGRRFTEMLLGPAERFRLDALETVPPGLEERAYANFQRWLSQVFRKDRPWTQSVRDMLDARGTDEGDPALAFPLSFYRGRGRTVEFAEGISRKLLGVRLDCARCHDHPYDKWRVEDYYGLAGFAARQRIRVYGKLGEPGHFEFTYADRGEIQIPSFDAAKDATVKLAQGGSFVPTYLFGGMAGQNDDRMHVLGLLMTETFPLPFLRAYANRVWAMLFGYGVIHPVDDASLRNRPISPTLLDALAKHLKDNQASLKSLLRLICHTKAYQRAGPDEAPGPLSSFAHLARLRFADVPLENPPKPPLQVPVPEGWIRVPPRQGALVRWSVPDKAKKERNADLLLVKWSFGPGHADAMANQMSAKRQKSQPFTGKLGGTLYEVAGVWTCDPTAEAPYPAIRLVATLKSGSENWFLQLQGPTDTVSGWWDEFLELAKQVSK